VEQSTPLLTMNTNDSINSFTNEYRFLSNFWPCDIHYESMLYPSVEHAYQAAKTLDIKKRCEISILPTPGQAKRAGKKVVLRPDWEKVKLSIMEELIQQKFENDDLRKKLQETFPKDLIEGNTWGDIYWGVCDGKGENHLGKLLMNLRDRNDFVRRLKLAGSAE
jgi:N-glycosidase YbiA